MNNRFDVNSRNVCCIHMSHDLIKLLAEMLLIKAMLQIKAQCI